MQIDLNKLNDEKIKSTGGKNIKMGFAEGADGIIFNMFTETIYKNPIGSIVREITSNCFDSHIKAGKETPQNPVIIKKTYDKVANTHYISFFDKGVGMSPETVEQVYAMYFESTKRDNNDEIGGFGIGGKTPLAYKRSYIDDDGKTQYDSSFFVITRYNGIEYGYTVYKGENSPELNLLYENTTKEVNGTEIRIPVKENDLSTFEREIKRQLYYFENIVFQGFTDDNVLNEYKVYKGNHFLYRGDNYDNSVHVCLGKVAYELSYSELGLSEWDYRIPIALKFDIGDIAVTANRESLKYDETTVEIIKDKIELAKAEIVEMISKQYNNVQTLEDYYEAKENFGKLTFKDQTSLSVSKWIKQSDVDYSNFKYNALPHLPSSDEILKFFYNVHEYGKSRGSYGINVRLTLADDQIYQCRGEFQRKVVKQGYLNYTHDKNFVILKPYGEEAFDGTRFEKMCLAFGVSKEVTTSGWDTDIVEVMDIKKALPLLKKLAKDVKTIVENTFESYDDLEVPQTYLDMRKVERMSKEMMNTTIPVRTNQYGGTTRVKIKNINDFKGRVYWGTTDEILDVEAGRELFAALFGDDNIDRPYSYQNKFANGKGIVFLAVAKNNVKYLKVCRNAYHISTLYPTMLRRKMINPANVQKAVSYMEQVNNLDNLYQNSTFKVVNKTCANYYEAIQAELDSLSMYKKFEHINFNNSLMKNFVDVSKMKCDLKIKTQRKLTYLLKVEEDNKEIIRWINFPSYNAKYVDFTKEYHNGLVSLLKKVMVF